MIGLLIPLLSLALLGPVMSLICLLTPWQGFRLATVRRRQRCYLTLHLSTFDRIGHLKRDRAIRFHYSFLTTFARALDHPAQPIFFVSHLLRPTHRRSLQKMMATGHPGRRWRCRQVPVRRPVRLAIRAQALLQEWRWITVPDTACLVVVRPVRIPSAGRTGR